jgi:hypothetical protein
MHKKQAVMPTVHSTKKLAQKNGMLSRSFLLDDQSCCGDKNYVRLRK